VAKADLKKIGIIGAGTMGAGLALNAAKAGLEVVLLDRDQAAAERGKDYAAKRVGRDVEKGRSTQEKADRLLARIHPTISFAALKDVSIVVEAVFEERAVKKAVIRQAESALPAEAVIASNTSALPISELAQFSSRPERFIGMHFFSPAEKMPLVEIIRGRTTSDATLAWALDLAQALRKTPIVVNDSPGFFTTRFIGAYITECMKMINDGVNPILVENAARMVGMPMGPMTISDTIGLDLGHHAAMAAAKERGEAEPDTGIIGTLVTRFGRHGVKNGKGFYDYAPDGSKTLWPGLAELLPRPAQQPSVDEVKQRILYVQLAEGARAFAEGVLVSAIDGDLGAVLGVGFPAYLGGPYSAIDRFGAAAVVAECDRLAAAYGPQFAVPQLLRDMAKDARTFHGGNAVKSPGARA
jgi:3-hydroxyacyl-CoA dehydrogenase/enoyl-CoA hydratase/3-hydroxybutyryl-CoA epimerase